MYSPYQQIIKLKTFLDGMTYLTKVGFSWRQMYVHKDITISVKHLFKNNYGVQKICVNYNAINIYI